jgi:hypothetical protein
MEFFSFMPIDWKNSEVVHLVFAPKSPFHEKVTKYFLEAFCCDGPSAFYSDLQSQEEIWFNPPESGTFLRNGTQLCAVLGTSFISDSAGTQCLVTQINCLHS